MKPLNPGYIPGDHWAICDRCGVAYRQSALRKEWDGFIVCSGCWEPRQHQDFVRAREDRIAPRGHVRPESADSYVTDVVFGDNSAIAGIAIAGIAVAGMDNDIPDQTNEQTIPTGTFDMSL